MAAQPVARAFDLDDDGVVHEQAEECRGDDRAAEDLAPFGEAAVRGQDHRAFIVADVDQLEEQVAATGHDRQVADLVDDEQGGPAVEPDMLTQRALAFGLGKRNDQIGERGEVDALAGLDGFDAERGREVAFAGARRSSFTMPANTVVTRRSSIDFTLDTAKLSRSSAATGEDTMFS